MKNQIYVVVPKMTGILETRSALLRYGAAFGVFIFAFVVTVLPPFVQLPSMPLRLSGSLRLGEAVPAPVMTDQGVIPALIIAAAVTFLLLGAYEIYIRKKVK